MTICHLCGHPLPHHHDECRVHQDLALFLRVYNRLRSEDRNPLLQGQLARHLSQHGRLVAENAA